MAAPTDYLWSFVAANDWGREHSNLNTDDLFVYYVETPSTSVIKHGPASFYLDTSAMFLYFMESGYRPYRNTSNYTPNALNTHRNGGMWFRVDSLPSTESTLVYFWTFANVNRASITIDENGTLRLNNYLASAVATHSSAISADTWYYMEWSITSSGTWYLWLDGSVQSGTGSTGGTDPDLVRLARPELGMVLYVECPWIHHSTSQVTTQTFTNPASCRMYEDAVATENAWTGSPEATNKYLNIRDNKSTGSYNSDSSGGSNNQQGHTSTDTIAGHFSGKTINSVEAVMGLIHANRQSTPTCSGRLLLADNGTAGTRVTGDIELVNGSSTPFPGMSVGITAHVDSDGNAWDETSANSAYTIIEHRTAQSRELRQFGARVYALVEIGEGAATSVKDVIGQGIVPFAR